MSPPDRISPAEVDEPAAVLSELTQLSGLVSLNEGPVTQAALDLAPCCPSTTWVRALIADRPYDELTSLIATSDKVFGQLSWPDLLEAVQSHTRIGERAGGASREASWSREEQSAAATSADGVTARALAEGNAAYEQRFGFTFLICAAGRTTPEVLAALENRMGNDPKDEREIVRAELAAIVRLRLAKAFGP
jgi:2-oxo-4-hydroxy-4-carboxy-5-ureidoimidazoline decarboxylase